jgi:hypothetical protein
MLPKHKKLVLRYLMEKLKRGMEIRLDNTMEIDTANALYKLSAYLTTTATRIPPPAYQI